MASKFLLPIAAVSLLALAACENRTEAPELPDPDAGTPAVTTEPVEETTDTAPVASPQEMEQRREEIEQEAQQTFESIMEDTERAGDTVVDLGNDAMNSLSNQINSSSEAISTQIDALVETATEVRDENMTDAQKLEVVANVRSSAEQAARALGHTDAEITAAGDSAEQRTRQALGLQ